MAEYQPLRCPAHTAACPPLCYPGRLSFYKPRPLTLAPLLQAVPSHADSDRTPSHTRSHLSARTSHALSRWLSSYKPRPLSRRLSAYKPRPLTAAPPLQATPSHTDSAHRSHATYSPYKPHPTAWLAAATAANHGGKRRISLSIYQNIYKYCIYNNSLPTKDTFSVILGVPLKSHLGSRA